MRLAVALLPLLTTPALADAVTYRGTIGDREAIFEFTEPSDGAVAGRFAFLDVGKSIPLNPHSNAGNTFIVMEEGRCTAELCTFNDEGVASGVPNTAEWTLSLDGNTLTGTRTGIGKTKLQAINAVEIGRRRFDGDLNPMTLRDNVIDAVFAHDGPIDPAKAPYELALTDVPLTQADTLTVGDAEIAMMVDPRTIFRFPRVLSFADGSSTDGVNAILSNAHASMSISALDCLSSGYIGFGAGEYSYEFGGLGDYDGESIDLRYASPKLVSWTEAGSLYCGGAHPYNHFNSFTYDVATGKPFDLSLIFTGWQARAYGEEAVVDRQTAQASPDDHYWRPDDTLVAYVRDNLPDFILTGEAELDEECFSETSIREQLDIRFEPGPVAVFTVSGFPHVISACNGDLLTKPLAELGDLLTPDAAGYFPELAQ